MQHPSWSGPSVRDRAGGFLMSVIRFDQERSEMIASAGEADGGKERPSCVRLFGGTRGRVMRDPSWFLRAASVRVGASRIAGTYLRELIQP